VLTATLTLAATTIPTKAEAADLFIPRGPVIPRAPVAYGGGGCGCQVRVPLLRRPAVLRHRAVSTVTAVGRYGGAYGGGYGSGYAGGYGGDY
jgi:hypothetical protein